MSDDADANSMSSQVPAYHRISGGQWDDRQSKCVTPDSLCHHLNQPFMPFCSSITVQCRFGTAAEPATVWPPAGTHACARRRLWRGGSSPSLWPCSTGCERGCHCAADRAAVWERGLLDDDLRQEFKCHRCIHCLHASDSCIAASSAYIACAGEKRLHSTLPFLAASFALGATAYLIDFDPVSAFGTLLASTILWGAFGAF